MQAAYAVRMEKKDTRRPIRTTRAHWLTQWMAAAGGPKAFSDVVEIVDTHLIAMAAGRRGIGDQLADRIEAKLQRQPGSMDRDPSAATSYSKEAGVVAAAIDNMADKEQVERVVTLCLQLIEAVDGKPHHQSGYG